MIRLADIYRHPIKAHGAELLDHVTLEPGKCLPRDRHWAVAHEAAKTDGGAWAHCANFSRGAKAPSLMAIKAHWDEAAHLLTLTHPDAPDLTFDPDTDGQALIDWSRGMIPETRAASTRVVSAPGRGMTDSDFPSISICNHASNRAVGQKLGHDLSPLRWRGNLWLDGLALWEEFDLIGKRLKIGETLLEVREPITRCAATTANPDTGRRDADTLGALRDGWNHQEFGVYAVVIEGGRIAAGDAVDIQ